MPLASFALNLGSAKLGFLRMDIKRLSDMLNKYLSSIYKGPDIPCFLIIKKCIIINTAVSKGKTKVCKL